MNQQVVPDDMMPPVISDILSFRKPFSELVDRRYSCRTFQPKAIDADLLSEIEHYLSRYHEASAAYPRMKIIHKSALKKEKLFTAGTYGMVKGARTFVAAILKRTADISWETIGFALQSVMMLATDLDLNSLWIGGVFDRRSFSRFLRLHEDEFIPAVIVLGTAAARRTARDRITRWGSRGDQRKSPDRLFFLREPSTPLYPGVSGEIQAVLENVRRAPSASNKQPWRVIAEPSTGTTGPTEASGRGRYHLYLDRDRIYSRIMPQVDLQRIDMGIAMFHLEMSARESGIRFERFRENPRLNHLPASYEYVVSYELGG